MLKSKDIIADFHIHTLASRHAFSTLLECVNSAHEAGMKYIAITDHYFGDGTPLDRKNEILRLVYSREGNLNPHGVGVLNGVELNVGQNIEKRYEKRIGSLSWRLLGLHSFGMNLEEADLSKIYNGFKEKASLVTAFAHIERELESLNHGAYGTGLRQDVCDFFDKITTLALDNNIYLEVNNTSLLNNNPGIREKMDFWIDLAKDKGNFISLGTDSHFCTKIGRFESAVDMLNHHDFPKERILNCNEDLIKKLVL